MLLRVSVAANYFSLDPVRMRSPEPLRAELMLDPFVAGILPQSVGPTLIFAVVVAVAGWLAGGALWRFFQELGGVDQEQAKQQRPGDGEAHDHVD